MAGGRKSGEEAMFAEVDRILESKPLAYPPSFSHYVWASEFCNGKHVLEIHCNAGLGTMILSNTASKCTGLDGNREMIKYALRSCHVEGKTKFAIIGDAAGNYSDAEVIVSFNTGLKSANEILKEIDAVSGLTWSAEKPGPPSGKTLIFGMALGQRNPASVAKQVASALPAGALYSFYVQTSDRSGAISELRPEAMANDTVRLIALIDVKPEIALSERKGAPDRNILDLVSIVIPTYNRADLISEAIDSALNQTYPNTEVIVVDDGSTDNTKDVVAKYGSRIRYYYKENGGIGSALNFGVKKMTGRWFKWLSSDDVLTPNAVEVLLGHAHAMGAMILYTDYDIIDNDGRLLETHPEKRFATYFEYASALWSRFIGNGSSILIERSCFDEVGLFDESLRSAEDYDWWLRACLLHRHRFFHVPETTLKYRSHGSQLTAAVKHNAYLTAEKIRGRIKQEILSWDPGWWQVLERYQKLYAKQNQKGGVARRLLRKSLLHMPEGMRKTALKSWQNSVKPRVDSQN